MNDINLKVQMMDAGMTLFSSAENFGNTLGQVKAEMEEYGRVLRVNDLEGVSLPESTGDYDLFLDWSTVWRVRYISCHLESAGEEFCDGKTTYRYAATFKEGNKSTVFRGVVIGVLLIALIVGTVAAHGALNTSLCVLLAGATAYLWILPSRRARKVVSSLMSKLRAPEDRSGIFEA